MKKTQTSKLLLSLFICLSLSLGLASCGGGPGNTSSGPSKAEAEKQIDETLKAKPYFLPILSPFLAVNDLTNAHAQKYLRKIGEAHAAGFIDIDTVIVKIYDDKEPARKGIAMKLT